MPRDGHTTWEDRGPASQGKILTAIMQDRKADAKLLLRQWSTVDLEYLIECSAKLSDMAHRVYSSRFQHERRP